MVLIPLLLVLSTSDGSSGTSQHQRSVDDQSKEEQPPASEKKETAQEAEQDVKKNGRHGEQPTLTESPSLSQDHSQYTTRDDEGIHTTGNERSIKEQVLSSIERSKELNGYMRDESIEPAQGVCI